MDDMNAKEIMERYNIAEILKVNINEISQRVLVLNGKGKILGKGTIIGHEPLKYDGYNPIKGNIVHRTVDIPVIKLDNGDIVKGTECWWISIVEKEVLP